MSSSQDAWLVTTGTFQHYFPPYERAPWERLLEPSVIVPALVLLVSIFCSSSLISSPSALVPPSLTQLLWSGLVYAIPAPLLFAIDDWLSPLPLPRNAMTTLAPSLFLEEKSRALARILGRNPLQTGSGIVASVSYAGKTGLARLIPRGDQKRPAGLGNLSNSCYQNSILQALSALGPIREYLAWITEEEEAGGLPEVVTAHTLSKLVKDLYGPLENGSTLWTPPVLKRMNTFQQQDAQEYFCKLLNEVQEEVEKAWKAVRKQPGFEPDVISFAQGETSGSQHSDDSGYHSTLSTAKHAASVAASFRIPFEGLVAQRIVCRSCGYSSGLSMSPFWCLTLNLGSGRSEFRLEETLDSFSAVENIEGVHCVSCTLRKFRDRIRVIIGRLEASSGLGQEATRLRQPVPYERLEAVETALEEEDFEPSTVSQKCKIPDQQRVDSTKTRQVGIARAPPSIAFHINRSGFDETTGYTFKNPAAVRFPHRLDLGPWCLGSAVSHYSSGPFSTDDVSIEDGEKADQNNPLLSASGDEEQWQLPPPLPMVAGSQHESRLAGPFYELRAVITHHGHHENGHYVCYRKHPLASRPVTLEGKEMLGQGKCVSDMAPQGTSNASSNGSSDDGSLATAPEGPDGSVGFDENQDHEAKTLIEEKEPPPLWWRLSDQNVSESNLSTVLAQGGVFMLFYDRIDSNSVFITSKDENSHQSEPDTPVSTAPPADEREEAVGKARPELEDSLSQATSNPTIDVTEEQQDQGTAPIA